MRRPVHRLSRDFVRPLDQCGRASRPRWVSGRPCVPDAFKSGLARYRPRPPLTSAFHRLKLVEDMDPAQLEKARPID